MHIEPGVVTGVKLALSYATAVGAGGYALKLAWQELRARGFVSLVARALIATVLVFTFFEILPHYPVGVSEVHFILGSTLFLLFGAIPTAIALAFGLLIQGLTLAPIDLPQYGMNLTTLLVPLFAMQFVARRVIAPQTAYVDLSYAQALKLSATYQGGVIAWVAFWALYGQGFGAENMTAVASFASAYLVVILAEPLADLAVLATAKQFNLSKDAVLVTDRLGHAA